MSFAPMASDLAADGLTEDAVLGGRLRLTQPRRGHRVGHDAILLAAATPAHAGEHAVDFGAGIGAAGLALAARVAGCAVTLVEIDAGLAALAAENARRNGLADRVRCRHARCHRARARVHRCRTCTRIGHAGDDESAVQRSRRSKGHRPTRGGGLRMPRRAMCWRAGSRSAARLLAPARHSHADLAGGRPRRRASRSRAGIRRGPGAAGSPESWRSRDPRSCSRHQGKPRAACAAAGPFPQ